MAKARNKRYDIRSCDLEKGDWISPLRLEHLFHYDRSSRNFSYHRHMLIERIQEESAADKRPLLCRAFEEGIKILTDSEALVHKQRQHRRCVKKLGKVKRELSRIRVGNLEAEEKIIFRKEKDLQTIIFESTMAEIRKAFGKLGA